MNSLTKVYKKFMADSLFRNSIYLMASTVVMAGFGFFFWMINARLYTAEEIGLGSTLISVITLITTISMLGLNATIIRYLPTSKHKNREINTAFTISTLTAIIISSIFLLGLHIFSPKLIFIKNNLYYSIFFIISMVFMTYFSLIESIFIALRSAQNILVKNTVFSILKLILPFALFTFGAMGIFGSWTIAGAIGYFSAVIILIWRFGYKFERVIHDTVVKKIAVYSLGNYIAGFISNLPIMILPLMITNLLSPETTAYYYMAMMIANLLFVIPTAVTSSLFAEGSFNIRHLSSQIRKTVKTIALILIPAILIIVFFGKYLLLLFGKSYSIEGFRFLQLISISGIFIATNSIFNTLLKLRNQIKQLIIINSFGSVIIIGLSYLMISNQLAGIGLAWGLGQAVILFIYIAFFWYQKSKNTYTHI